MRCDGCLNLRMVAWSVEVFNQQVPTCQVVVPLCATRKSLMLFLATVLADWATRETVFDLDPGLYLMFEKLPVIHDGKR